MDLRRRMELIQGSSVATEVFDRVHQLAQGKSPVVVILDSTRAGEAHDDVPIVGSVDDALAFEPTTVLVGVATQGGRFPPAWRELLRSCIRHGLGIENGLHEFLTEDAEMVELAARHGVSRAASASASASA